MKKHPITKIFASAAPDGRIKAKIYRGHSRTEPVMFNTVQDLFEWPEISEKTELNFRPKGIVPDLTLPCEPIFYFCSPDEIIGFVAFTQAGDRAGWLEAYANLIKSLQTEQFSLASIVGNSVDFTDLISNPKGYTIDDLIRRYEDGWFK